MLPKMAKVKCNCNLKRKRRRSFAKGGGIQGTRQKGTGRRGKVKLKPPAGILELSLKLFTMNLDVSTKISAKQIE